MEIFIPKPSFTQFLRHYLTLLHNLSTEWAAPEDIFNGPTFTIHADQNVMLVYYICKSIAGELAALISNEYAFDMVTTLYFALSYKYFAAAMLIFWELWPV